MSEEFGDVSISQPTSDFWEIQAALKFEEPLAFNDPRYVDTTIARGNWKRSRLLRHLGVDQEMSLRSKPGKSYLIFCGHRGCGKSTELRRLTHELHSPELFHVVFLDSFDELDVNNLSYPDVLLALAKRLFVELRKLDLELEPAAFGAVRDWFDSTFQVAERKKIFDNELAVGGKAAGGVSYFAKIFTSFTSKIRTNTTHKTEIRHQVRNTFTELSEALNTLLVAAEDSIRASGKGKALLFVVDGLDRLSADDSKNFFIQDANQLLRISSNFIYCAPIHLIYEGNQAQQFFEQITLPMIKLREKHSKEKMAPGYSAMSNLVQRRIHLSLFDSKDTLDYLIENSGGNPRELLRLVKYTFLEVEGEKLTRNGAEAAVKRLGNDYSRFLSDLDMGTLREIDSVDRTESTEVTKRLLYNLALLEYNSYWWMSHPAIQKLDRYTDELP